MAPHAAFWLSLISAALCLALAGMVTAWTWALGRLWSGRPLLPAGTYRPVPWRTGSVLLVVLVWVVINIAVSVVYLGLTGALGAHRKPTLAEQMAAVSIMNGMVLVAVPLTLRLTSSATVSALGLARTQLARQVAAGTVGFLVIAPPVYLVNWLSVLIWKQHKHPLEQMVFAEPTLGIACLALLSAVALAPAAEELLFRGIIQNWLAGFFRRDKSAAVKLESPGDALLEPSLDDLDVALDEVPDRGLEPLAPIILTSALFAAVHLPQWPAPIAIFLLSTGLGVVYQRTGSLIASFVMHALFNGFSTLILFQAVLLGHPADPNAAPTATWSSRPISATAPSVRPLTVIDVRAG
jgi:membrane protease YdiL (CAAX protease family)